jgi:hypothetical protein
VLARENKNRSLERGARRQLFEIPRIAPSSPIELLIAMKQLHDDSPMISRASQLDQQDANYF